MKLPKLLELRILHVQNRLVMLFEELTLIHDEDPDRKHCRSFPYVIDKSPLYSRGSFQVLGLPHADAIQEYESDLGCLQKSLKAWKHSTSSW